MPWWKKDRWGGTAPRFIGNHHSIDYQIPNGFKLGKGKVKDLQLGMVELYDLLAVATNAYLNGDGAIQYEDEDVLLERKNDAKADMLIARNKVVEAMAKLSNLGGKIPPPNTRLDVRISEILDVPKLQTAAQEAAAAMAQSHVVPEPAPARHSSLPASVAPTPPPHLLGVRAHTSASLPRGHPKAHTRASASSSLSRSGASSHTSTPLQLDNSGVPARVFALPTPPTRPGANARASALLPPLRLEVPSHASTPPPPSLSGVPALASTPPPTDHIGAPPCASTSQAAALPARRRARQWQRQEVSSSRQAKRSRE